MSLRISKDLALPLDAVTQTFSILAMRRVGKTYTASVMAEEMVAASIPFAVLDPTGAWWGLRAAADGKSEGLPVVIIGGEHGDVPLEATAGKVIADLVVDRPGYYVIDLSATESNAEQDRFATDFAERLYRRKAAKRTPLHLFVDEADSFAPQRPLPNQLKMLGAFEALVRRGGIRGIGTTLITQRPAILNKNVLTQSECLIVLQMNAPQDQDAIDDWVKRNGTPAQRDMIMKSMASLSKGEAWFWSPSWLRVFKKVQIRERRTFNSSATPKPGEKTVVPQKLAPVDIEHLTKEIAATIERAAENDPTNLKRKINELKQTVTKLEQAKPKVEATVKQEKVPYLTPSQEGLIVTLSKALTAVEQKLAEANRFMQTVSALKQDVVGHLESAKQVLSSTMRAQVLPAPRPTPSAPPLRIPMQPDESAGAYGLSKCERAILTVLAQYPQGRSVVQIAVITGYSSTSGGFKNALSILRTKGFITRHPVVQATEEGMSALGSWEPLPTGQELCRHWLNKLPKCEAQILGHLADVYPNYNTAQEIAESLGYSPTSGGFKNALSRLRTLELIKRGHPIQASDHLFQ
jgi:uncharacterized protein YbcI